MDQKTAYLPAPPDALNIRELLSELWRLRIPVGCAIFLCAVAGVAAGLFLPKEYEARITLSPAADDLSSGRLGGLASLASQFGGLGSLAGGLSLPGKTKRDEVLAVLQSELLTEAYIRQNNLLPVLYWRQWDPATGKWTTTNPKKTPTLWKANRYFNKNIRDVKEDKKSDLVVMSIRWTDPKLAAKWANDLVKMTNDYLRAKAISESQRHIDYLNDQLSKITIVDAQKAIYALLQQEINTQMVARGREEYALKVIDPAVVPELAVSPGARVLGPLGLLLGAFLSVVTVAGLRYLRA